MNINEAFDRLIGETARRHLAYTAMIRADGQYTLEEAIYLCDAIREAHDYPPLVSALIEVAQVLSDTHWAICGGLAVGSLTEPRATKDVDILVADRSTATSALLRSHQFHVEGNKLKHVSGGEIDVLNIDSGNLDVPKSVALQALKNARENRVFGRRMLVVTPAGLIAMKLGRATTKSAKAKIDQADIMNLVEKYGKQDLANYDLTTAMLAMYESLVAELE